jgi:hypothetical protein
VGALIELETQLVQYTDVVEVRSREIDAGPDLSADVLDVLILLSK